MFKTFFRNRRIRHAQKLQCEYNRLFARDGRMRAFLKIQDLISYSIVDDYICLGGQLAEVKTRLDFALAAVAADNR